MKKLPDKIKNIIIEYLNKLSKEYSKINILRIGATFNISKLSAPELHKMFKPVLAKNTKKFEEFKIKSRTIFCYTKNNNLVILIK
jgi:hypothetical protein